MDTLSSLFWSFDNHMLIHRLLLPEEEEEEEEEELGHIYNSPKGYASSISIPMILDPSQ